MLEKWRQIRIEEIKDAPGSHPPDKRKEDEGRRILARLDSNAINVALTERGTLLNSEELAILMENWHNRDNRSPRFIIGGPFGLPENVVERSDYKLSLSPMTWPHELARVLLMEQLYRAHAIITKTGYHH